MQKIARASLKRAVRRIVVDRARDGEDQVKIKVPLKYLPETVVYLRSKGFTVFEDKDIITISW